jgi:hypothetical protein
MILKNSRIKIQMRMQKKMIQRKDRMQECSKYKRKMMKKKQKVVMLTYINQEEHLYNFYRKAEM